MSQDIVNLFEEKRIKELKHVLVEMNPADLALKLQEVDEKIVPIMFRLLPKEEAADVFAYMDSDTQVKLINSFTDVEIKRLIDESFLDDTVDMIEEMPANVVSRILKNTDAETRKAINDLLNYPDDSAGSIMTIEYVSLPKNFTVAQAFDRIRSEGIDKETVYTCYVTDNRKLIGLVSVKDMLLANSNSCIADIMETNIKYVTTHSDQEDVAKAFSKYDLMAMPVVDNEQRIVGIVTFDDAMDVLQEENTEDFSKMAAMEPIEDSYFKTSVFTHARHRILWLFFLMLSSTITGSIITKYENAFAAVPLLVSFIPMLTGTGGNCGSQSSTIVIRGLALDDIKFSDFFKVIFKEFRIALLVSALLSVVNGLRIYFMYDHDLFLALVVSLSMIATIIMAKCIGCILPMISKKIHLDPAIMAAPLISTIVDACSILIYFNIAMAFLNMA